MTRTDARPARGDGRDHRNASDTSHLANSIVRVEKTPRAGVVARIERPVATAAPSTEYACLAPETAGAIAEVADGA